MTNQSHEKMDLSYFMSNLALMIALNESMRKGILLLYFLLISLVTSTGQITRQDSLLDEIAFYADVMVNAELDLHRIKAHNRFQDLMQSFIASPMSCEVLLDTIPWISVLNGPDFRVITWQLRLSNDDYKYGGFIQWPNRVVELKDTRPWINGSLRNTYTAESWYGALYYKLVPFKASGDNAYLLFGFNAENSLINTKVADVLDLSGTEPKFGMPVFTGTDEAQTRLILTYADASSVQLLYDPELNAIVHDHLENLPGVGPNGETLAVSDGSQEGWFFKEGKWVYQEEVYDVKSEVPPMGDDRKDRKEDKDLFGRPKKE